MQRRVRLATSVLAVLLALGLLANMPAARAAMNRPTWTVGDSWTYGFHSSVLNTSYNGTLSLSVVGMDSVQLNGTGPTYSTYHLKATLSTVAGGLTVSFSADVWYDVTTLAIVEIKAVISFSGTATLTIWGDPPQTIQWPLTNGATWTSSTNLTEKSVSPSRTSYMHGLLTTNFEVQADTQITVPAGTFSVTPVKETQSGTAGASGYLVNYWSPQAGNSARTESYNSTGHDMGGYNLTAYNYQGGSFLSAVYFGLSGLVWLIILAVVIIVIAAVVVMRRRRPRAPMAMPPYQPPMQQPYEPPPGPPGTGP